MRNALAGLFMFLFIQHALAQEPSLKGIISDTLSKRNLQHAVISLIQPKDSVLYCFTRSDSNGNFHLDSLHPGKYKFVVTYPKFAAYTDEINITAGTIDLGIVPLTLKSKLLDAVVIKSSGPIRIKGDTTEFVADSFKVKEGATVEDLLKKLPGITVDSKGQITAQGKQVEKVLVDGEEFFGNDPTMATQNLSARAVDKVQVFDSKTEQQSLKGVNSESDAKTVNIKLKDEFKKGAFGKAEIASDFNHLTDGKLLYNYFKGKKKVSAYITKSNTGGGNLDWDDQRKMGLGNDDIEYDEMTGFYSFLGNYDEFNNWDIHGLPDAVVGGALFGNKWNGDIQSLNGSYKFNRLGIYNQDHVFTKNILPSSTQLTNQTTFTNSLTQRHGLTLKYEWKIDSFSTLTLRADDNYRTANANNVSRSFTTNDSGVYLNSSERNINSDLQRKKGDNQLIYKRLFKKPGRILYASARYSFSNDVQKDQLFSANHYYTNGLPSSNDTTDQQKLFNGNSGTAGLHLTYSEPLNAKWSLIFDYSHDENQSSANKTTMDKGAGGKYELFNALYSNHSELSAISNNGSLLAKYVSKKLKFAFGSGISSLYQSLHNLDSNTRNQYNFTRYMPKAQFNYTFRPQTSLSINYEGRTTQPNLGQLQPLRDNNDPLNIMLGNPDLKPGFRNDIRVMFNSYKVLKGRSIWINGNISKPSNDISTSSTVDNYGKRITIPVNVNGNITWNVYSNWNRWPGNNKLGYGGGFNGNGGRNISYVNGQKSINDYSTFGIRLTTGYSKEDQWNFNIRPGINHSISVSSLQPLNKTSYYTANIGFDFYRAITKKWEFNMDGDFNIRQKIAASDFNTNAFIWNASLSKKIFKKGNGKISIIANDLLDQNKGYNRVITSNFIKNESYSQISRYFMLHFEWTFNQNPSHEK